MGCQNSICDSSELLLSQHLAGKLSENISHLEKTTNISSNSLKAPESEQIPESVKKFYLLKSLTKLLLKDLPNISNIIQITEIWIQELTKSMDDNEMLPEDLKTSVSLESNGRSLTFRHELDGLRNFKFIKIFATKAKLNKSSLKGFKKYENFLMSLCPLTVVVYLKLAENVDFGFGVEKPLDKGQVSSFIDVCKEKKSVFKWSSGFNQPIPTSVWMSGMSKSRFVNFYVFDGLQEQNIGKGFELFEELGAPVPGSVIEMFRISKADEVNCCVEFDEEMIRGISLQIKTDEVCEGCLGEIDTEVDLSKWKTFHSLSPASFLTIELTSNGFLLKKVSLL